MNRKTMLAHLKSLGVNDAIADPHAMVDDSPAILLRWNGAEEYYTGFDIADFEEDHHWQYRDQLVARFGDK